MSKYLDDILAIVGAACLNAGIYQLWPRVILLSVGVTLIAFAVLYSLGSVSTETVKSPAKGGKP
jgi:hypothetical protein